MALQATEMLLRDGTCVLLLREYPQWLTETFVQPGREIFFGGYVVDEVTFQLQGAPSPTTWCRCSRILARKDGADEV